MSQFLIVLFVVVGDLAMLLYTVYFWSRSDYNKQFGFLLSFLLWLVMDMFVFQVALVLWNNVILPNPTREIVTRAKEQVVQILSG